MDYENLYTQGHGVWLFSPSHVQQEKGCATDLRPGTPGLALLTAKPDCLPPSLCNQNV